MLSIPTNEILQELIQELSQPSSHYIKVVYRQTIHSLLLSLKLHREHRLKFSCSRPSSVAVSATDWPNDILSINDLSIPVSRLKLRQDVRGYIWSLVERALGPCHFKLHYLGDSSRRPLRIETAASQVQILIDCIDQESGILRDCEFLPRDVIEVVSFRQGSDTFASEEGFASGMGYKNGTIGGILSTKGGTNKVGITAGHVERGDCIFRAVSEDTDCAFFEISSEESCVNLWLRSN